MQGNGSSETGFVPRPVLVNSWEAAYFNFTGETIVELAREAAGLGIDMVVMDDGWHILPGKIKHQLIPASGRIPARILHRPVPACMISWRSFWPGIRS